MDMKQVDENINQLPLLIEQSEKVPSTVWTDLAASGHLPSGKKESLPKVECHDCRHTKTKEEGRNTDEQHEADCCFICLESFESTKDEPVTDLPCKNSRCKRQQVHSKCIYEWRQTKWRSSPINTPIHSSSDNSIPPRQGRASKSCVSARCPLCRGELENFSYLPPDLINSAKFSDLDARRQFLTTPVSPKAGFVRCFIKLNHVASGRKARRCDKIKSVDSPTQHGAKIDVGVYELYLQSPTTLKYPLGPVPDYNSPRDGDRLLATGNRTRFCKSGIKRGPGYGKIPRTDLHTTVSQIDLYMGDGEAQKSRGSYVNGMEGKNYIATVKSSFSGFKHEVLIPTPSSSHGTGPHPLMDYEETCCVHFIQNRNCIKNSSAPGPRKIQVCLPKVKDQSNNLQQKENDNLSRTKQKLFPQVIEQEPCITPLQAVRRMRPSTLSHALTYKSLNMPYEGVLPGEFTFGRNKEPYWLESIDAYSLDFRGRVTMPSNKNFQLILDLDEEQKKSESLMLGRKNVVPELMRDKLSAKGEGEQDDIALQFGKVGGDDNSEVFSMDFRWPLTPLQAFGICLGACDRNLSVV